MPGVTIRGLKDGPYEVSGGPGLVDVEGASCALDGGGIPLCRGGRQGTPRLCDGTHKKAGFHSAGGVRLTAGR